VDEGGVCPTGPVQTFAGLVNNAADPPNFLTLPGSGIPSVWSFAGQIGIPAGNDMCQVIGADHVCTYAELVQAENATELAGISDGTTIWLHRVNETVTFEDPANPGVFYTSPPGPGGRCNDWTMAHGHVFQNGQIIYHFDKDTVYTGVQADGHAGSEPSDGGQCGGVVRAIPCCFPGKSQQLCLKSLPQK